MGDLAEEELSLRALVELDSQILVVVVGWTRGALWDRTRQSVCFQEVGANCMVKRQATQLGNVVDNWPRWGYFNLDYIYFYFPAAQRNPSRQVSRFWGLQDEKTQYEIRWQEVVVADFC